MPGEMGGISGRMRGVVVKGEDIERVLAQVPEQTWHYDDGEMAAVGGGWVEVPMRVRREIISHVLAVVQRGA